MILTPLLFILFLIALGGCGKAQESYSLDQLAQAEDPESADSGNGSAGESNAAADGGAGESNAAADGSAGESNAAAGGSAGGSNAAAGGSAGGSDAAADGSGTAPAPEDIPSIYVHVCGAVERPGVVTLPQGSRAEAAVLAAGGMNADADPDYVNLAAPLTDGEKLYIPTREETESWQEAGASGLGAGGGAWASGLAGGGAGSSGLGAGGGVGASGSGAGSALVNLNTADSALLQTLPGIGESRAADIIAYRSANGAFASIEEIMKVPGIKENAFQKIKDLITV